jgi:hypothetical protein
VSKDTKGILASLSLVALLAGSALAAPVRVSSDARQVNVSIVRRVEVPYYVVSKAKPLEFEVTGPTWLRIYTRVFWPATATGPQRYRLSLWQDDAERPIETDAVLSPSSYGPKGRKLGAWRSFFVQVPAGSVRYRLAVNDAPSETVGVRIVEQAPRPWQAQAVIGVRALNLVEGRDTSRYYEIRKGQSMRLELVGPCHVRVRCRLGFDPSMAGTQGFVLTASEGKTQLAKASLRAAKSPAAAYVDEPGVVPSTERALRFSLPEGRHEVVLQLTGTLAKTAGVRVETLSGEKYE